MHYNPEDWTVCGLTGWELEAAIYQGGFISTIITLVMGILKALHQSTQGTDVIYKRASE